MKFKLLKRIIAFSLFGVLLGGCDRSNPANNSPGVPFSVVQADAAPISTHPAEDHVTSNSLITGINDFSLKLTAMLADRIGSDANLVCSPFSAWLPLAALANAANDDVKAALLAALCSAEVNTEEMNIAALSALRGLTARRSAAESSNSPLRVVNTIFVDSGLTPRADFVRLFADYYQGTTIKIDFASDDAARAVNRWADENTGGLITEIITEFAPSTVAAAASAVYFSDQWRREFNPAKTKSDVFHSPTGDEEARFMLRDVIAESYYEDERVQALPLEFRTGGGMYIVLPKDGNAAGLLSSITGKYFDELREKSKLASGRLLLPRFSVDSGIMSLGDLLSDLGVLLFNENGAPLTGGLVEDGIPMWLSDIVQRACITVDERGVAAAAVTIAPVDGDSPIQEPISSFEMKCDKPFVFMLYADTSGGTKQLLFTGAVNHPASSA
jgi:serpin B